MRGFTLSIPPVEEWDNFTVLDVNGGSFLYPELMFTCNGTLNSVTIPYMIVRQWWIRWERNLELTLAILRRNVRGNYVQVGEDILLREQFTNIDNSGYPSENTLRNATQQTNINIQKQDILLLIGRSYNCYYTSCNYYPNRRHIPAVLTTYPLPGSSKTLYFPMIHVNFSGQTKPGDTRRV